MTAAVPPAAPPADSAAVRDWLAGALRLDLIGPTPDDAARAHERLPRAPSRWYLAGFLVPAAAPAIQAAREDGEDMDDPADSPHGGDDAQTPDRGPARRVRFPSSIGLTALVDAGAECLDAALSWGDYRPETAEEERDAAAGGDEPASRRRAAAAWVREPRKAALAVRLADIADGAPTDIAVPGSDGLELAVLARRTTVRTPGGEEDVRAVSLFVVNRRAPAVDEEEDAAFAFQVEMSVAADAPFVARGDAHGLDDDDWDERLADLHYRDAAEYAVGHNVSVHAEAANGKCRRVRTEWTPRAAVERVEPAPIAGVAFGMEALGALPDAAAARAALEPLPRLYRAWIADRRRDAAALAVPRRREVAAALAENAARAAGRIEAGIALLARDAEAFAAFRIANRAMAAAARRREAAGKGAAPERVPPPEWRPFQLAYLLMNLRGIAEPEHEDRETVDLLFFPTGGGKTEAYLGLAAFTMALRRLRWPDPAHRGLSVLMRYTLRLLTLDQLGRAAALVCALELEREKAPEALGERPFEIALWVGRAATPNRMGRKGASRPSTARAKVLRYRSDSSREPPLPIEQCPWCGTRFGKDSFRLHPNPHEPTDLHVSCARRSCDFNAARRRLPVVAVDEPIYARTPAFMIATADKFAALPWTAETAAFFGGGPEGPRPPDLVVQDELHLITGPLGSMAGLYETAIDRLCSREIGGQTVRPKIVASTATARLAARQVRALFDRARVAVFPPPGPDRRDSFFARAAAADDPGARLYLGIAAPGRGPKVVFLRAAIAVMAAAQAAWEAAGGARARPNPADPYMTAVAYFNALRELGGARRIVEDEIGSRLQTYSARRRGGETPPFADRVVAVEPVELTSRVSAADVADARRRLALDFGAGKDRVDIALATNMISVGLDIARLGLMLVSGQPKTASEYIQATSRIGRDPERPGLAVALLNVNKPRDRSHYERFAAWHASFYRGVEAASVTPFSPRALDRALPAVAVALARLGVDGLAPPLAAADIAGRDSETREIARAVGARAQRHADRLPGDFGDRVRGRVESLVAAWAELADAAARGGTAFGYARREPGVSRPLLREMIDPDRDALTEAELRFRAPRSLRDVEPGVLLGVKTPEGKDLA